MTEAASAERNGPEKAPRSGGHPQVLSTGRRCWRDLALTVGGTDNGPAVRRLAPPAPEQAGGVPGSRCQPAAGG